MSLAHIGVGTFRNHMSRPNRWLRRYGLFFDRFDIIDLKECLYLHRTDGHGKAETVRECDELIERGFLTQCDHEFSAAESLPTEADAICKKLSELQQAGAQLDAEYQGKLDPNRGFQPISEDAAALAMQLFRLSGEIASGRAQLAAILIGNRGDAVATSLEMFPETVRPVTKGLLDTPSLLRFVIDGLPVPAARVPWSEILAFKEDQDSQERLRSLRLWVSTTARGGISLAEASDRVEDALTRYRTHVRAAGLAHDIGTWEALLRSGAISSGKTTEDWLDAAGGNVPPFSVTRYAATSPQAEAAAPGRELSYIVKLAELDT